MNHLGKCGHCGGLVPAEDGVYCCDMLRAGVVGLYGPQSEHTRLRARVAELEAENAGLSTEIRQVEGLRGKPDGWLGWHRLASARAITVHDEQAMAALPLSARYDVVERECERLRARVAELEATARDLAACNDHGPCAAKARRDEEDLRRKREECERLERMAADLRHDMTEDRAILKDVQWENERLRRELGKVKR